MRFGGVLPRIYALPHSGFLPPEGPGLRGDLVTREDYPLNNHLDSISLPDQTNLEDYRNEPAPFTEIKAAFTGRANSGPESAKCSQSLTFPSVHGFLSFRKSRITSGVATTKPAMKIFSSFPFGFDLFGMVEIETV